MPRKPSQTSLLGAIYPVPVCCQPRLWRPGLQRASEKRYCPLQPEVIRGMSISRTPRGKFGQCLLPPSQETTERAMRKILGSLGLLGLILIGISPVYADMYDLHHPRKLVDPGTAGHFVILTKTGITDVPNSAVTGNVGVSPITGNADHLTCPEVDGKIYSVNAAGPPPCNIVAPHRLTVAVGDMETAYRNAAGRNAKHINVGGGDISGLTLRPGVYRWDTDVHVYTDAYLKGDSRAVWIFQVSKNFVIAANKSIKLLGHAQSQRIFWQIAGFTSLGAGAHIEGIVLDKTMIDMKTGASVRGRLYAQTALTLEKNRITEP